MCVYRLITFLALVVGYDRVASRVGVAYLATAGLLVSAVGALTHTALPEMVSSTAVQQWAVRLLPSWFTTALRKLSAQLVTQLTQWLNRTA